MEWVRDFAILQSYQERYRLDLGLLSLMVDRNEDGKYFYEIFGASRRKSKQVYETADAAQTAAIESARYQVGNMAAKLNSIQ